MTISSETTDCYFENTHKNEQTRLCIVVPCYNEQEVLQDSVQHLLKVIEALKGNSQIGKGTILLVDDGSTDRTWDIISLLSATHSEVSGIKLAHNVGHQQALWAGMETALEGNDALVSIDADLQDDEWAITQMVEEYNDGKDIVYGVRRERTTDTRFKRDTAQGFYRLMKRMGAEIVYNHADFRLLSHRAAKALIAHPERNIFIRGMVARLGFSTAEVYYDRRPRLAGESKYPLRKMLAFALEGITSFSVRPLQYITMMGLLFMLVSLAAIIYGVVAYCNGKAIAGWTSLLVSLWFIGGAILLACGIIGEYIGKIYTEVKRRPRYFIENTVGFE